MSDSPRRDDWLHVRDAATDPSNDVIRRAAEYVRSTLEGDSSGHDWWHIWRVWQNAMILAREENADLTVVALAALLHDVADWKFHDGDETAGPRVAREWLEQQSVPPETIDHVCEITDDGCEGQ